MLQHFETILISFVSIILMFKIMKQAIVIEKIKNQKKKLKNGNEVSFKENVSSQLN